MTNLENLNEQDRAYEIRILRSFEVTKEEEELAMSEVVKGSEFIKAEEKSNGIYIPTQADWNFMVQWGAQAIKSRMLPTSITSPEAVAIIILKGRELGLSFMTSIANIYVVGGKPCMSAELIQGLARKNLPGLIMNIIKSDEKIAEIEFIRPEKGSKAFIQSFTIEQAIKAKLTEKNSWIAYPAAMLWSRAVTAGLRKICPEALMGISYSPEEMGAEVSEHGDVIETTGKTVVTPPASPALSPSKEIDPLPIVVPQELINKDQANELVRLCKEAGESKEDLTRYIKDIGASAFNTLKINQFKELKSYFIEKKKRFTTPSGDQEQLDLAQQAFGEFDKELAGRQV